MADAIVDIVGQDDLPVIVDLYNQIYRPAKDADSFRRRFRGTAVFTGGIPRQPGQPVCHVGRPRA